MFRCEYCGIEKSNDERIYIDGDTICQDCWLDNCDNSYGILNYGFKKAPYFCKLENETTKKYFGFELEISNSAYWLGQNITPSNTIIYVREKYILNEHSTNYFYITYVYQMITE